MRRVHRLQRANHVVHVVAALDARQIAKARRADAHQRLGAMEHRRTNQRHGGRQGTTELTPRELFHARIIIPGHPLPMPCRPVSSALLAAVLALAGTAGAASKAPAAACPVQPVPELSRVMPLDVCIPDGFTGIALDYFDDYSWRALVSLAWPAGGRRGLPSSDKS